VLLTPDDMGAARDGTDNLKPRARQNVIFELGFFSGKLGRQRVCALHKGGVEIPSDFAGVVWVPMDLGGAWRFDLVWEMRAAGWDVDSNKLL
jgi:predicted nucleotide-binding protein